MYRDTDFLFDEMPYRRREFDGGGRELQGLPPEHAPDLPHFSQDEINERIERAIERGNRNGRRSQPRRRK